MPTAAGTFEIVRTAHPAPDAGDGTTFSAFRIDKRFEGDLVAKSVVEMLAVGTPVAGSAAYVAVERINGAVHGRSGTFAVHHTGVMDRGAQSLSIRVVPDSGTGELEGISGTMTIEIVDGEHRYGMIYALR